ncbi:hypothetical protein [Leucobacter sp. GX24907]
MTDVTKLRSFLAVAGAVEVLTLVSMLVNLATVDSRSFAATIGPIHGLVWVGIIVVCLLSTRLTTRQRVIAALPIIGGILAALALRKRSERAPSG